ncbi:39S ribosomal protein L21, mitochondrial-like [Stylophora pistillata]|uniref:Large ribosomal subunit protein bL21m n=1 Tax=Stylophora pistillata TaxID=50429 RepID=A0A2B4SLJ7_STYPI|nr:39S ribosomal protein L21, mitochondrial-like [Stylophora pistillata]PFX31564.1 39S ribosomal protein L21, mitochondrial [Stylophora pistillata]
MAAKNVVRCANLLRSSLTRNLRKTSIAGLSVAAKNHKYQGANSSVLARSNLVKNSFTMYTTSTAAVTPFSAINPVGLLGNVDIRSLCSGSSSLTEASGEDDDEQNCPPYSSDVIKDVQDEMLKGESSGQIFAVVHIGGSQFKITVNDTIIINRIDAETGDRIHIEKVLLVGGENFTVIGTPLLVRDLVKIEATVLEKTKGPKKIVFKMKRRKGYRRWKEHFQDLTVLRINSIQVQPSLLSSAQ